VSKEFKIGLITIIAGALLYYGFNYLRGSDLFSPTKRYYVIYPNVAGLTVSNPVVFNGLNIGRVSGLNLQQSKNRIVVSVDIDESFYLGKTDTASLANNDLFGTKALIIIPGSDRTTLEPGDTLKAKIAEDLLKQLEPVADNINTTITKINDLLDQLNSTDISGVVDTLKYSIGTLTNKANRLDLETTVEETNTLIASFNERSRQLEVLLNNSNDLVDSLKNVELASTIQKVNTSLEEVNKLLMAVQSEEGTVGKLLKNDSLYDNLNRVILNLDSLVYHFDNYPKHFFSPLGKKKKKIDKELAKDGR